jgi:hypothetical protein
LPREPKYQNFVEHLKDKSIELILNPNYKAKKAANPSKSAKKEAMQA